MTIDCEVHDEAVMEVGRLEKRAAEQREQIEALEGLLSAQVEFTERLRKAANAAIAHAAHINQNYTKNVPREKLSEWAEAQVVFNVLSVTPSPAQAISTVVRDGAAVN